MDVSTCIHTFVGVSFSTGLFHDMCSVTLPRPGQAGQILETDPASSCGWCARGNIKHEHQREHTKKQQAFIQPRWSV